jgi:type I restriction enzyme S subunit
VSNYQLSINNYQLPEGYKQTEVGVIPESWEVIPITKATNEIFLGLTARVDYVESGGIPLVRATDIAKGKLALPDLWWEMYRKIQNANRSTAET